VDKEDAARVEHLGFSPPPRGDTLAQKEKTHEYKGTYGRTKGGGN